MSNLSNSFLTELQENENQNICRLKTDWGGEYNPHELSSFCANKAIRVEQGPAKKPEHNAVSEWFNRTLMENFWAQMFHANLPNFLSGEIMLATFYIINMSPKRSSRSVLLRDWNRVCDPKRNHDPDYSFLGVLGCAAYPHIHKSSRSKLDPTSELWFMSDMRLVPRYTVCGAREQKGLLYHKTFHFKNLSFRAEKILHART